MNIGLIGGAALIVGATAVFAGQTAAAVLVTAGAYGGGSAIGAFIGGIPEFVDGLNDGRNAGEGVTWDERGVRPPEPSPAPPAG